MPNINLTEKDLTTPGGLNTSSNVVYVPGFAKHLKPEYAAGGDSEIKWPHLFTTTSEFLDVFSNNGRFEYIHLKDTQGKLNGSVERTMPFALSILQTGLPVLFDLISTSTDGTEDIFELL